MQDDDLYNLDMDELERHIKINTIIKTKAEVEHMQNDTQIKLAKINAEIESMRANNNKLDAERKKFERETKYMFILNAGATAVILFFMNMVAKSLGWL